MKNNVKLLLSFLVLILSQFYANSQTNPANPNILVIIADDLGVDVSNGYQSNALMPTTPTLDGFRSDGLTFMNAWSTPVCTPTRAATMSGKYGVKTGVNSVPGNLDLTHTSIFNEIANQISPSYSDAVIGKWHISNPSDYSHPQQHGIDHYDGVFKGSAADYYMWDKVTNGVESVETTYATSYFSDEAINWVNNQNTPWFLWLAEIAPHTPFHVPPSNLYTTPSVNTDQQKYVAAIEAMDTEVGRLLDNIPPAVLDNTLIIYFGDNGTPNSVNQSYPGGHGKGSLYQGGIHVPMIVVGPMVSRVNETENGMIHVMDIYATILEVLGHDLPGGINNSLSFKDVLSDPNAATRPYNYSEVLSGSADGWTVRNDTYKLLEFSDGTQEFYNLITDPLETIDLIGSLTPAQEAIKLDLEQEANAIRTDWSCRDLIQNGTETGIDVCTSACANDNSMSTANIGCCASPVYSSDYTETISNDLRLISTNNYPDHNFCYNPNQIPAPLLYNFEMDKTPQKNGFTTSVLKPNNRPDYFFGVALNGVLYAPAPAAPFIFEDQNTGQYNWDWVFEPTTNQGNGIGLVSLDCASAHTGPQGYHYHGNMFEYVENVIPGISTTTTPPATPLQIGWAADGFPILYRFGPDLNGNLTLLEPGYEIIPGDRPGDGITAPCGPYNGKYTNDYQYSNSVGDLDECNGVERSITLPTAQGMETFDYFYMITDSFPQIARCFVGTPNETFNNANSGTVPLELISFNADYNRGNNSVDLAWTTSNENQVSVIELERSLDGLDFNLINTIQAFNSMDLQDYESVDNHLIGDYQYYRLKIIDYNGSFSYSNIIGVEIQSFGEISVFPNPAIEDIHISFTGLESDFINVEIINMNGITVRSLPRLSIADKKEITFPTKDLTPSIYFIRIWEGSNLRFQEKIVITH